MGQKTWFILPVNDFSNDLEIQWFNHTGRVQMHFEVLQKDIIGENYVVNLGDLEEISGYTHHS